jgi:hypothetical protein
MKETIEFKTTKGFEMLLDALGSTTTTDWTANQFIESILFDYFYENYDEIKQRIEDAFENGPFKDDLLMTLMIVKNRFEITYLPIYGDENDDEIGGAKLWEEN